MESTMRKLKTRIGKYINEIIRAYEKKYNKKMRYAYQACADDLNKLFELDDDDNDKISPDSVERFFNGNYTQRNALWIMLGLLRIHKIPYERVFPAVATEYDLNDAGYFQTYHGIMYPRNSELSGIENLRFFTMTISPGKNYEPPSAILSYENKGDENHPPISRQFCGTPVLSPQSDIVSILFHDDNPRIGTFFHFYFPYHLVNATYLKFNRGFVVTTLSDKQMSEIPVALNFIMRNQPIDSLTLQTYPNLETLLQYANSSVYVQAEEFHAILSEYSEVSYLFNPDERLTKVTREDLCVIDEPRILRAIMENEPKGEQRRKAYHCLLELKKASHSPTRITWEALYDDLFKTIMGTQ